MDMIETVHLMCSTDYKKRFKAEYWQTKIRYEKLKQFNQRIEASVDSPEKVVEPKHDCSYSLLRHQQAVMGEYLSILETRAIIEDIDLSEEE